MLQWIDDHVIPVDTLCALIYWVSLTATGVALGWFVVRFL